MSKKWLFKYRGEIPFLLCVLTTFMYSIDSRLFFAYRPNLSLFVSLFLLVLGVATHIYLGRVSDSEEFKLNKYPISIHSRYLGDFIIWLALAFFTGSLIVVLVYTILYVLQYGIVVKRDSTSAKIITMSKIISRDLNNIFLFNIGLLYISGLKNYMILDSFDPHTWIKILFLIYIGIYILGRALLSKKQSINTIN